MGTFCLHWQVIKLLGAMHLSQYQDNFMQEHVDGELFLDLDEHMLEYDLKVCLPVRLGAYGLLK